MQELSPLSKSLALLSALLLFCCFASAQEYSFRTLSSAEGLGNLTLQKLYQDRSGFLWVSTENGLFRFDGQHFEAITPADGLPLTGSVSMAEAADGTLLIGGSIGLFRSSGDHFVQINGPFKTVSRNQGITTDAHGQTYLATDTGLYTLALTPKGPTYQRIYPAPGAPAEKISNIFPEADSLWFGCNNKLCRLDSGHLTTFGTEAGMPATPIVTVLRDSAGTLWVRVRSEGILELPAGATRFRYPDTPTPGRTLTGTPALDRAGHILLGSPDGLILQTPHGWQLIDRNSGIRGGAYAALEDRQHNLWIGTGGHGLTQWRGYREWEGYSSTTGLPSDNVYTIAPQPDGSLYAGTEAGLAHGTPGPTSILWTTIPGTQGLPVHSLQFLPSGDILLATANQAIGLLQHGSHHLTWYGAAQGLNTKRAFTLHIDRNKTLWAATDTGIFTSTPPYTSYTRVPEVPATWFWTITEAPDGTIWAGGADGLFAFTSGKWRHFDKSTGLRDTYVSAIGPAADGSVWVGYENGGGLDRIRLAPTLKIEHDLQRPGTNGLIYYLSFDHEGLLWVGTERGVDMWNGSRWAHFDTTNGLIWDDADIGAFASSPDGTRYFGTSGGLSIYRPRADKPTTTPSVLFTDLHLGESDILDLHDPTFRFGSGTLTARFAAPDAPQDSSLLFRYRLQGQHSPWTTTAQRQLELAALAPGNYQLEVQARDNTGLWSERSAVFLFHIQPPWYRRWWFILFLFILPFIAALSIIRIRSVAARVREQRLRRVVDARTLELRAANEELTRLTLQDALTGLSNRRRFDTALAAECDRVNRSGATVSLILIDVDHFKALNDSAGHQKGDEYLVTLGRELMTVARRKIEVAARIGGEEFALLLPATSPTDAVRIAEAVRRRIESLCLPHPASPSGECLTVSIGVATASRDHKCSPELIFAAADEALYRAKSTGRNRVVIS